MRRSVAAIALACGLLSVAWLAQRARVHDPRASPRAASTHDTEAVEAPARMGRSGASREAEESPSASIRGLVFDRDGHACAARVLAYGNTAGTPMVLETRSAADGAFSLVVHAGCWFVHAESGLLLSDDEECNIVDGASEKVRLDLDDGTIVTGRVMDPSGRGTSGAVVSRLFVDEVVATTVADETGAFEVLARVHELVDLRAESLGFVAGTASVEIEPYLEAHVELRLGYPREIRGRVTDTRGLPVSGAMVRARALDSEYSTPHISPYAQEPESHTDTEGRYHLTGLREGLHAVQAMSSGFLASMVRANSGDSGVDLQLTRSARIEGTVLGPEGGERPRAPNVEALLPRSPQNFDRAEGHYAEPVDPFADPTAWILGARRPTDAEGRFVIDDLAPGDWVVRAWASGCAPTDSEAIHLEEGGARSGVVIRLQRAGVIQGRVLAKEGGAPVQAAEVWYHLLDWTNGPLPSAAVRTDAEGCFLVPDLVTGRYRLEVRHASFLQFEKQVDVVLGVATEVVLELDVGARLNGRATDRSGCALVGADVYVLGSNPRVHDVHVLKTDSEGRYVVSGMYPGRHVLTCTASPRGATTFIQRAFDIRDGESVQMDLTCQEGATLRGRVIQSAERTGSSELRLYFGTDSGDCRFMAIVDGEGGYCVDGVPAGSYRVHGGGLESRVEVPHGVAEVRVDLDLR